MGYITNKQTILIDKRNISKFKTIGKDIIIKEEDLLNIAERDGCRLHYIYTGDYYLCIQNSITEISGFFRLEKENKDTKAKYTLEGKEYHKYTGYGNSKQLNIKTLYRLLIVE